MQIQVAEFTIGRPRDVAWSAQRTRLLGSLAGLPKARRTSLGKAVSQCVAVIVANNAPGTIKYGLTTRDGGQAVEIVLRFQATGSPLATAGQQPSALDCDAFAEPCSSVDDSSVERDEAGQITVWLGQSLPAAADAILPAATTDWSTMLATRSTQGALATTQRRMGELAETLQAAQTRGIDLERELASLKSLTETLELLALVASKTDNAVIILDADARVEWVNDGFVRMTGYELAGVQGKSIGEVLYGDDKQSEAAKELANAIGSGHGVSREILHHRKDGRTYWASIDITPVFGETGSVLRWIGIANDATHRRHAQEELRQAKDAAESASRAKSEFLANMSHEIRTPMNAIIGMTDLTLDTNLDSEQRDYLTTVLDSAEALLRLLNDILDLSKIEAGKLSIETLEFSLAETLRDSLRAFTFQARQKGLKLDHRLPLETPERLIGDPARLRQIITNLVGNAIKFTHEGGVTVAVDCLERSPHDVTLCFSVCDTGIGIPEEKLEQIFEAFTQADSSTSRRFGGTGLGLTISTQLVELMSGRIWVESEENRGSTFYVELSFQLPSAVPADSAAESTNDPTTPSPHASDPGRKLHVLVADDNRANRQLAMRIVQKKGHSVAEADNGHVALARLKSEPFDVVLLDVQMPGMDGLEVAAEICQLGEELPRTPYIIAMTAHAMQGDRERCLAAGMDSYIAKPIRTRQLSTLIEAVAAAPTEVELEEKLASAVTVEYDFSLALDRLEGDKELLIEQMGFYLEDSPILIRDIRAAIDASDGKQLQMAAHRLRGLSAVFDATDIMTLAGALEEIGRQGVIPDTAAIDCDELDRHWQHLCAVLEAFLATTVGASS